MHIHFDPWLFLAKFGYFTIGHSRKCLVIFGYSTINYYRLFYHTPFDYFKLFYHRLLMPILLFNTICYYMLYYHRLLFL
jgi:hypothetical protein